MCKVLNINLHNNDKFKTNANRNKNIEELKIILEDELKKKTTTEWCKIFEENKIPCGPINNIKEV